MLTRTIAHKFNSKLFVVHPTFITIHPHFGPKNTWFHPYAHHSQFIAHIIATPQYGKSIKFYNIIVLKNEGKRKKKIKNNNNNKSF